MRLLQGPVFSAGAARSGHWIPVGRPVQFVHDDSIHVEVQPIRQLDAIGEHVSQFVAHMAFISVPGIVPPL